METKLSIALKEWDLLCTALLAGEQAILLRKGGIYEAAGEFELEHSRFLLFPTFLHQDPRGVKTPWRPRIVPAAAEPAKVRIAGWAEVHAILPVPDRARLGRLDDLHLWDTPLLDLRFAYRPEKPLYLCVVQAWRLPAVVEVPNTVEYAGCKSWVPLQEAVSLENSVPAIEAARAQAIASRVRETFR